MDAIARVESRIFDVQARFAGVAGRSMVAPATAVTPARSSAPGSFDTSGSASPSFRDVADAAFRNQGLSSSISSGISSMVASAAPAKAPGGYGPVTVPRSLAGAQNGRLPDSLLESIGQGQHRLEPSAAVAFRRMATAAAQDGVSLRVTDSYRTLASQERTADDVGLYKEGGLAALPGTSTHGWGLSVDLDLDIRAQRWLRANANRFGFAEDVAREPWHYTYRPADI